MHATGSQDGGLLQAWDASRRLVRGVRRRLGADENDILPIRVRFTLSPLYIRRSDIISTPARFRRHLVGETLINVFHCNNFEIRFVGKLVIIQTVS